MNSILPAASVACAILLSLGKIIDMQPDSRSANPLFGDIPFMEVYFQCEHVILWYKFEAQWFITGKKLVERVFDCIKAWSLFVKCLDSLQNTV